VFELLAVPTEPTAMQVQTGWRRLVKQYHPDTVSRFHSVALTHLAEEINILINRGYDRLRQLLNEQGRGASFGSSLATPHGWLVGFEDLSTGEPSAPRARSFSGRHQVPVTTIRAASEPPTPLVETKRAMGTGEINISITTAAPGSSETFEQRARLALSTGDADGAREMLAMSLVVYPRSRPLRSLYYVASSLVALRDQLPVLAASQLEAALAHDENCREAHALLECVQNSQPIDGTVLGNVFGSVSP
jgi:hypothetical protein